MKSIIKVPGIFIVLLSIIATNTYAQSVDDRAENIQNGTFNIFMSADQSYFKNNSASDNNPYGYGYWVAAHGLETLSEAYQRTRNVKYKNRMKSILRGIRKYNLYGAETYRNDYYDDLEWLCLASISCYRATKDTEYLDAAHQIWDEIKTGYKAPVMSWKKGCTTPCNNSIGNSPAIIIALKLYELEHDNANLQMAKDIHAWMKANVLNAKGGIWDSPNNFDEGWQFSYNSGLFIGACLELNLVTGTQSYIDDAIKASEFMMNYRYYNGGVFFLNEKGQGDGGLFKGIFARYFTEFVRLGNLTAAQKERYLRVINFTGNYAWDNAVNKTSYLCNFNWGTLPTQTIDLSTHVSGVHLMESVASLNKVHVYQDINYSGFYSQLAVGNYTLAQLQARGVTDNDITSFSIPTGYTVTVYENDNFSGASKTFTSNTGWLADWNDRISSIKINNANGLVTVFQDVNYGGYGAGFGVGNYKLSDLVAKGVLDNDITSVKVKEGFKVIVYTDDNFGGTSLEITADNGFIGELNDKVSSLKVLPNGNPNLAGTYYVKNNASGFFVDLKDGNVNNGTQIRQWSYNGSDAQKFKLVHLGNGNYSIVQVASNKVLDVEAVSSVAGANILQWDNANGANQHFIFVDAGNGLFKMIAEHTGMVAEVSTVNSGDQLHQWYNNGQANSKWLLVPTNQVIGTGDGLRANYFNGKNFETPVYTRVDPKIDFSWGAGSPNAAVNADAFSARWTGQVQAKSTGTYTFYINSDNGRRLWVNNQLIIDKWINDYGTEYSGTIALAAGQKYDIKVEYFEDNGGAENHLSWSTNILPKEIIPQTQLYSNALPVTSITSPVSNAGFVATASITINATATDANGTVAKVEFYNGATLLGTSTTSPYSYNWTNVGIGTYTITTRATDDKGAIGVSSAITVKVNANQKPTVSITSPVNGTMFNALAAIDITADAKDQDGSITKVEFYNGTALLGTVTASPYTYNWKNVAAGNYTITAKATDNNGATAVSSEVKLVVNITTGLNDIITGKRFSIAPNPVHDHLEVFYSEPLTNAYLLVTDIMGREIIKGNIPQSGQINVSELQSGLYILIIHTGDGLLKEKFVKN